VRDKFWLVGSLGSEPRLALSHTGGMRRLSDALVKTPRQEEGARAGPRLYIEYPGICLTTEKNHGKPQRG